AGPELPGGGQHPPVADTRAHHRRAEPVGSPGPPGHATGATAGGQGPGPPIPPAPLAPLPPAAPLPEEGPAAPRAGCPRPVSRRGAPAEPPAATTAEAAGGGAAPWRSPLPPASPVRAR